MKLQRSTLILMLVALLLGGYVYIFEIQRSEKQAEIQAQDKQIFTFSRDDVQTVTVTTPEQTIVIERIGDSEEVASPWKMTQPAEELANQASVDYLLNQLVGDQSLPTDENAGIRRLTISSEALKEYGLDEPTQKVEVKLKNEENYQLVLGQKDFTGESIYAQVDPPEDVPEEVEILVIPETILSGVERPLEEWKMPEELKEEESSGEVEENTEEENTETDTR